METPHEDSSPRTLSNVVFVDIPRSYPPSRDITCCFTITSDFQPTTRDWIGVFKVGWSHKSNYHTFVWADMNVERSDGAACREAVFKEYHLPKDEENSYQFCYMDNTGQVRGASRPFSFITLDDSNPDSSIEEELLVVYTKEEIDQAVLERDELKAQRDQASAENETLSSSLRRGEEEITILKVKLSQKNVAINDMESKLGLLEEENKQLMHKAGEFDAESQRLQGLILSGENENKRLSEDMQRLRRIIQNLEDQRQKLPQCHLREELGSLVENAGNNVESQVRRLEDSELKLKKLVECLEQELQEIKEQQESRHTFSENIEDGGTKILELKLKEVQEIIAVKNELIKDKDDMILFLQRQNKELIEEKEGLQGAQDKFQVVPTVQPELLETRYNAASYSKDLPLQETQADHDHNNTGITGESGDEVLECRYCKERFPGISQQQLEQHEISHKVCPFCLRLCDHMDQVGFEDHVYSHN